MSAAAQAGGAVSASVDRSAASRSVDVQLANLREHGKSEARVIEACEELVNLTAHADGRARLLEAGGVPLVIAAMATHARSSDVAARACGVVSNLSATADGAAAIVAAGGIVAVVTALKGHVNAFFTAQWVCRALKHMSAQSVEYCRVIGAAGAIPVILAALRKHTRSEEIAGAVSSTLLHLVDVNAASVVAAGGIAPLLAAMKTHARSLEIVRCCCTTVSKMPHDDDDVLAAIAAGGAAPLLLQAAAAFPSDELIVMGVCATLHAIGCRTTALKRMAADAVGHVPAFVAALRRHPESDEITRLGISALMCIWDEGSRAAPLASAGGVAWIVDALVRHVASSNIAALGCRALATLCVDDRSQLAVVAAGGISALVAALQRHEESADVAATACAALDQIVRTPTHAHAFAAAAGGGGIPALVAALRMHSHDDRVARGASGAMALLVSFDAHATALTAAGCIPPLVALAAATNNGYVALQACRTLHSLATRDEATAAAIIAAGGTDAVRTSRARHGCAGTVAEDAAAERRTESLATVDATTPAVAVTATGGAGTADLDDDDDDDGAGGAAAASLVAAAAGRGLTAREIRELVGVLADAGKSEDAKMAAIEALVPMSAHEADARSMVRAGALRGLLDALGSHEQPRFVALNACSVLGNLVHHMAGMTPGTVMCTIDAPLAGVAAVVKLLQRERSMSVKSNCCTLLMWLATNATNLPAIVKGGAIPALVGALLADASTMLAASLALRNLARAENVPAIEAAGGVEALIGVLRVHAASVEAVAAAAHALSNMMLPDDVGTVKPAFIANGGVPLAVAALTAHRHNKDAVAGVCRVLALLTTVREGRDAIVTAGGIPPLVTAMAAYANDAEVAMTTCRALTAIASGTAHASAVAASRAGMVLQLVVRAAPSPKAVYMANLLQLALAVDAVKPSLPSVKP